MSDTYRFTGLALTPTIFATLLREQAPGQLVRRSDAIAMVLEHHESRGGAPTATNLFSTAKKALSTMVKQGIAEPAGAHGYYRIEGEAEDLDAEECDSDSEVLPASPSPLAGSVYVYYLPVYEQMADLVRESVWPHKIGMTLTDVGERLRSQVGTALPEAPVVARVFPCEHAALLERALHSVLELRGRKLRDAPGNEWFMTNVEEIDEILTFIGQDAASDS